jgi:diguanylate cyclase (GGDEF)-like protein/PAS domain S-box-containing protein
MNSAISNGFVTLTDSPAAILIVDDNDSKRLAVQAVVEPLGHSVMAVDSGEAALRAVSTHTFAVILMDVQMPEMNGYEAAQLIRMRGQSENTPIIFVTSHSPEETQIPLGYAMGAVDFIFAPIDADILRAKVTVFVELYRKSLELEQTLDEMTALDEQIRDSDAHNRAVLENVADGIITIGQDGVIESFNRSASALFGYTEEEARGKPIGLMIARGDKDSTSEREETAQKLLARKRNTGRTSESLGQRKDGSRFAMELDLSDVQLGGRKVHIACVRDVSDRHNYTQTLRHHALHDNLTKLPNRVLFSDRVAHALQLSLRDGESVALFVLDLDNFKRVNDSLGHEYGDELLKQVAGRLRGCLREVDTVARLGGDELGVLPLAPTDLAAAAEIAWKIQSALEPMFNVKGHEVKTNASIGIAVAPQHGNSIDDLLRRADLAMYEAKRSGDAFALFATEQEETPARRLALLSDLRHCVERNELTLHYQPKINLKTRKAVGLEALVRWNHPSGKLVMPGDFMPEVESSELMVTLTQWVANEAFKSLAEWLADGFDLTMAINVGARCLAEGSNFFTAANALQREWNVPATRVTLELTESALIDTAAPQLNSVLRDRNERLSIDDFGTGYSSLVYLQQLPVVEVKADRSFVTNLSTVEDDAIIVRAIIDLAHNLDLEVVAEGVEDKATMDILVRDGCDVAQGFYFGRPMPKDAMTDWLEQSEFGLERKKLNLPAAPVNSPQFTTPQVAVNQAH